MPGGFAGQEFLQRGQRSQTEEQAHAATAREHGQSEQDGNHPPGIDATIQIVDDGMRLAPGQSDLEHPSDQ
ncbi:hypothetical protein [Candidatus Accumulibacter contiguus]|uniref:hypothetical protein n=1 Tax=Candidatus Accumulibacter contiguus TaxID=2954381 RepID=UPI0027E31324|nr:hypothetical protein [Candidatus Accumulibacter contiguus]